MSSYLNISLGIKQIKIIQNKKQYFAADLIIKNRSLNMNKINNN